jgi:carboxylesterase type B
MKDNFVSAESAVVLANALSTYLACADGDLTCLRSRSTGEVMEAAGNAYYPAHEDYFNMNYYWYGIVLESDDFPFRDVFDALPPTNSVPTLTGITWNEGLSLFLPIPDELKHDKEFYKKTLEYLSTGVNPENQAPGSFSTRAQELYDVYPFERNYAFGSYYPRGYDGYDADKADANYLLSMMYHDISYYCNMRRFNNGRLAKEKKEPNIYSYVFSHVASCSCSDYPSQCLYTTHSDDLPFLASSDLMTKCFDSVASPEDIDASLRLRSGFVNFIHTGNPNTGPMQATVGPVGWPRFTAENDRVIEIGTSSNTRLDKFRANICAFWDYRGYFHGFNIGDPFF